jgi:hypothetical protein
MGAYTRRAVAKNQHLVTHHKRFLLTMNLSFAMMMACQEVLCVLCRQSVPQSW